MNRAGVSDVQVGMRRTLACALIVLAGCAGAALPAADASAAVTSATARAAASAVAAGAAGASGSAAGFRWSARASSPLGTRTSPLVVWAGRQLLEIGGLVANGSKSTSAGAAFDPAAGRWHRIAPVPGDAGVTFGSPGVCRCSRSALGPAGISRSPTAWSSRARRPEPLRPAGPASRCMTRRRIAGPRSRSRSSSTGSRCRPSPGPGETSWWGRWTRPRSAPARDGWRWPSTPQPPATGR